MLETIWTFLKDPAQSGGPHLDRRRDRWWLQARIWAVVKFFAKKEDEGHLKLSVKAEGGSVAIGGDNKDSPINIGTRGRSER